MSGGTNRQSEVILRHIRGLAGIPDADALPDRVLLERFTERGDEAAFTVLVRRHGPMVLRVCRGVLGNVHDAEDAFQATFLVLARKAGELAWQDSVAGWLHEAAYRLALKARTAGLRRRAHEGRAEGPTSPQTGPLADMTLREAQAILNEELNRLPDRLRIPLVLCYLEGITQDEAAHLAGWSLSTLKRRLRDGLELLQGRLQRRGVVLAAILSATLLSDASRASAVLITTAARAATAFHQGLAVTAEASRAVALAQTLLRSMFFGRVRSLTALLVATAVLAVGGTLATRHVLWDRPAEVQQVPKKNDTARPLPPAAPPLAAVPARAGDKRLRFAGSVQSVVFSPNGKGMVAAGATPDGPISFHDAATGKELWKRSLGCSVRAIGVSPDDQIVAVAGDKGMLVLCDARNGAELHRLKGHTGPVASVAFTKDNATVISAGRDGTIRFWDRTIGKEVRKISAPNYGFCSLVLSPDNKLLAAGCEWKAERGWEHPIGLWELPSGKERPPLSGHNGPVGALAFSPDGRTLASAGQVLDGYVRLWDVETGRLTGDYNPVFWGRGMGWASALAFSQSGQTLVCGCLDNTVYFVDPATGRCRGQLMIEADHNRHFVRDPLNRPDLGVLTVAFSPDGKTLATGGSDRAIRLWDTSSGKERLFGN
jgi:RNA polymerase sigma factor (sigma-70 family)